MERYLMDDGKVVDTDKATQKWEETTDWNGNNMISRATGSQWAHETLYRSAKGRYYLVHLSQGSGTLPRASWVLPEEAARWLLMMEHELPEDLTEFGNAVCE